MMINWDDAASVVLAVVMRKSICRFQEMGVVAAEFVSVLVSAVRFSSLVFRRHVPVPTRHPPLSTMVARHDRSGSIIMVY